MKKLLFLLLLASNSYGQLKVMNTGYVAIGINFPNYPLHVNGWGMLFNDINGIGAKEIKFRPNNGGYSEIGSDNYGQINIWNSNCWSNGGWGKFKLGVSYYVSDQRLKKNIEPLLSNLAFIKQLNPKKYNQIDSVETVESNRKHYGFLAQDVQNILPDLVDTTKGVLALNYNGIIPFLVGAVKEQSETIDSLRQALNPNGSRTTKGDEKTKTDSLDKEIKELKEQIQYIQNNCCQTPSNGNNNQQDEQIKNALSSGATGISSNENSNVLLQNIPNPFDNTTTIKFSIPEKYDGKFYIKIYTMIGEERMSYMISKTDKQIVISSGNLPSGIYLYALIANNDVLGIKQMVISK